MESEKRFFAFYEYSEQALDANIKAFERGIMDILHLDRVERELLEGIKFNCDHVICSDGGGNFIYGIYGLVTGYSRLMNGVPVMWFAVGGHSEIPVAACAYLGADRSVHVYVPSEGNVFNRILTRAYRRSEWDEMCEIRYNFEKLVDDASSHIVPETQGRYISLRRSLDQGIRMLGVELEYVPYGQSDIASGEHNWIYREDINESPHMRITQEQRDGLMRVLDRRLDVDDVLDGPLCVDDVVRAACASSCDGEGPS